MLFNAQQPTTLPALSQLYTGNPNLSPDQVDSNLLMSSGQGRDYIHDQAQNLGIGDPVAYFNAQKLAQTQAQTPSGGTMEALRLAGQFSPTSLPGQLAAHQAMIGQVQQQQTQQAGIASLQNQQALNQQYQLPINGAAPTLSPLMKQDMTAKGITDPTAYLLQQRLGANRNTVAPFSSISPSEHTAEGGVDPEHLYNAPTFQAAMQAHPDKAAGVFSALTGGDLGQFHTSQLAKRAGEVKQGSADLHEALTSGKATVNQDGTIAWRKLVPDPMKPGALTLSSEYGPADIHQKSLEKYLPNVSSDVAKFADLAARRGGPSAATTAPVASMQTPPSMQAGQGGLLGDITGTLGGMAGDFGRVFTGGNQTHLFKPGSPEWAQASGDYGAPAGSAVQHADQLRNNPQFLELLKKNPAKARALIQAIQQSGGRQIAPPPIDQSVLGGFGGG